MVKLEKHGTGLGKKRFIIFVSIQLKNVENKIFSIYKYFFYNYLFPKRISQKLDNSQQINAGIVFNFEAWACGPGPPNRKERVALNQRKTHHPPSQILKLKIPPNTVRTTKRRRAPSDFYNGPTRFRT